MTHHVVMVWRRTQQWSQEPAYWHGECACGISADSDDRSGVETVLEECTVAAHMAAWSKRRAS